MDLTQQIVLWCATGIICNEAHPARAQAVADGVMGGVVLGIITGLVVLFVGFLWFGRK